MMSPRPKYFNAKYLNFAHLWAVALVSALLSFTHHTLLLDSEQTVILLSLYLYLMKFFPKRAIQ